jgi:hypothetical protein
MSREHKEPSANTPLAYAGAAVRTRTNPHPKSRPRTGPPATTQRGALEVGSQNRPSAACCALLRPTPLPAARQQTIEPGTVGTRRRVSGR